jgi:aryl-alcohol dehydrogenase-like predicted oxidoreductase
VESRTLGALSVSVVGLGCNNFGGRLDQSQTTEVVHAAIEAGVTLFDTADIYGGTRSEEMLGVALGARRDAVVIATKFGMPIDDERHGAHPEYVARACEDSLRRLQTSTIDLYQLHAPDATVPIADTLGALGELVTQGKVLEVGCSNFSADQLRLARDAGGPPFVSVQNQYSLLWRNPETDGVVAACDELGMGFLPYYPLANGLLTGKVRPGAPIPEGTRLAAMSPERSAHWLSNEITGLVGDILDLADDVDIPILTLAFSWLLSHSEVSSVIAGCSNPEQVRANVAAATNLPASVRERLDEVTAA